MSGFKAMEDKVKLKLTITVPVPGEGTILALKRLDHVRSELLNTGWKIKVNQLEINPKEEAEE